MPLKLKRSPAGLNKDMRLSARITRLGSAAPPDGGSLISKVEQETLRQLSDAELKALESAH